MYFKVVHSMHIYQHTPFMYYIHIPKLVQKYEHVCTNLRICI
jgi:hypothetical protein